VLACTPDKFLGLAVIGLGHRLAQMSRQRTPTPADRCKAGDNPAILDWFMAVGNNELTCGDFKDCTRNRGLRVACGSQDRMLCLAADARKFGIFNTAQRLFKTEQKIALPANSQLNIKR
jgi:hypothetical protein